jgi:hypothetical protein
LILTSAAAAHIPEKWAPVPACAKPLQGRTKRLDASAGEGRFQKKRAQFRRTTWRSYNALQPDVI